MDRVGRDHLVQSPFFAESVLLSTSHTLKSYSTSASLSQTGVQGCCSSIPSASITTLIKKNNNLTLGCYLVMENTKLFFDSPGFASTFSVSEPSFLETP